MIDKDGAWEAAMKLPDKVFSLECAVCGRRRRMGCPAAPPPSHRTGPFGSGEGAVRRVCVRVWLRVCALPSVPCVPWPRVQGMAGWGDAGGRGCRRARHLFKGDGGGGKVLRPRNQTESLNGISSMEPLVFSLSLSSDRLPVLCVRFKGTPSSNREQVSPHALPS